MVSGTHILIANIVYKYLIDKMNFKLDWPSFAFGNIRPDLDKECIKCPHTMEDSLDIINSFYYELIKSNVSIKEYSMGLGIICHFVCDYFCLHHTKKYWKKDPLAHGMYEVSLHIAFIKLILSNSLNLRFICKPEKDVKEMVIKIRRKYKSETDGITTDINYSLLAAISICELISRKWLD